jgi:hypothetical protein
MIIIFTALVLNFMHAYKLLRFQTHCHASKFAINLTSLCSEVRILKDPLKMKVRSLEKVRSLLSMIQAPRCARV